MAMNKLKLTAIVKFNPSATNRVSFTVSYFCKSVGTKVPFSRSPWLFLHAMMIHMA
jgi:hypothetical protein